ncbi:MAG: glutamine--fructose-6-phosphate transaminase (isomerizing) [Clostridiales bacterium]|nr:glutamine--fructose-6-phosphate transaminase (isomerizing) [Clostridiales bacterium]
MCGIFGYIGKGNAYKKVMDGLSLLQYRGYDSCGIAYKTDKFNINKTVGTLDNLAECGDKTNIAFGHTRWATNGVVNIENTHPHISHDDRYIIVHNGIINNADIIKNNLLDKGISFYSNTDTEVIVNLLTTYPNLEDGIKDLFHQLEGTYSLIIANEEGDLYLVRKFSPLNLLVGKDGIYISSDISSLSDGELYSLKDNDIIKIHGDKISSLTDNKIEYVSHINNVKKLSLGTYQHYMIKEIKETPEAIKNTYYHIKDNENLHIISQFSKFTFIGCGTAYHSCLVGEYFLKNELNLDTETILASNYDVKQEIDKNHLHIIVSQSGETADCIKVAEKVKKLGGKILLISNEPKSTIAKITDFHIFTQAKKEIAVASTKTYCCQVFVFAYMCELAKNPDYQLEIDDFVNDLIRYINSIDVSDISQRLQNIDKMILIGKDIDYITLLEASLKIREIDYIYTLPMYSGELKHGTLSLIDKDAFVLTLNTSRDKTKLSTAINEIQAREGKVINFTLDKDVSESFRPIYAVIPFQLISYQIAVLNGRNPDMPRNLAKSVTVE